MNPDVWQIITDEWRKAGMSDHGIAGVLANVQRESNFNPTLRHPDQPHWGGEAHYAHGLYQEGGEEWNNYAQWLNKNHPSEDWQDPRLQSEFAAQNLKNNYPKVWEAMSNATSPVQAGASYASGYLKPAANLLSARIADFQRSGVPTLDDYANGTANYKPSSPAVTSLAAGNAPASSASSPAPQQAAETSGSDTEQPQGNQIAGLAQQELQQPEVQPTQMPPMQAPTIPQGALAMRAALNRLQQRAVPQQQYPQQVNQQLIDLIGNGQV